jgi:hypothetical protein
VSVRIIINSYKREDYANINILSFFIFFFLLILSFFGERVFVHTGSGQFPKIAHNTAASTYSLFYLLLLAI